MVCTAGCTMFQVWQRSQNCKRVLTCRSMVRRASQTMFELFIMRILQTWTSCFLNRLVSTYIKKWTLVAFLPAVFWNILSENNGMKNPTVTTPIIGVSQELQHAWKCKELDLSNLCANYIHVFIIPDTEELSSSTLLPQGHRWYKKWTMLS